MSIPLFDMAQHIESNRLIFDMAFNRVLDSTRLIMSSEVENFEGEFAEYLKVNFCTSVANGTDALEIALRGLGANEATRVGLAGNCGGYARAAIELVGCTPVYVSIDPTNYFMSFSELSDKIIEGAVDILTEATGLVPSKVKAKLLPPSDVYLTAEELLEYGVADHIL